MSDDTTTPFEISKARRLNLPLALLISLLVASAVAYAVWVSTREQVARNTLAIFNLQAEAKTTREILIRIDENVKDIRRVADHRSP